MSEDAIAFDTSSLQEILFDDIRDLSIHNGIFRCTLYAFRVTTAGREPVWVPVLPVAIPVSAVVPAAAKAIEMVTDDGLKSAKEFVRKKLSALVH